MPPSRADEELIKSIAREAATIAVKETMISLGLDPTDPKGMQADHAFVRTQREFYAAATRHGFFALVSSVIIGLCALVWSSIKTGKMP